MPLAIWLQKSYLTSINEFDCILFVDKYNHDILRNLYYCSKLYACAKTVYPNFKSLHVSNTHFLEYLKHGKVELYSLEVL